MNFMTRLFDTLRALFTTNPEKVVVIGMNNQKQIISLGVGDIQVHEAIVMLSTSIANSYLELTEEQREQLTVDSLLLSCNEVVRNRIRTITEIRMKQLQQQMNQVQEPVHTPSVEPMPVPVEEEDHSTVIPAAPAKRTRKKAKEQLK